MNQPHEPKWVSRADVEAIHETVIEVGGGSHGLRDEGLLESALARPQNLHAYGENDLHQLAASYAEGIARNHAFVDGNKRTAFQTAHQFLKDNGQQLEQAKGHEHAEMMEKLGQGQISREDAAAHFQEHCRSLEREQGSWWSKNRGDQANEPSQERAREWWNPQDRGGNDAPKSVSNENTNDRDGGRER